MFQEVQELRSPEPKLAVLVLYTVSLYKWTSELFLTYCHLIWRLRYHDGNCSKSVAKKWICVLLISIVIISTCLLDQMQANSSGVEFLRTISKFRRERQFCHVLFTSSLKPEIRHFHVSGVVRAKKCTVKMCCSCFAFSTYCFFDVLVAVVIVAS